MGYRIRVVPEVEAWLEELRDSDPGAADLVDGAWHRTRLAAGLVRRDDPALPHPL